MEFLIFINKIWWSFTTTKLNIKRNEVPVMYTDIYSHNNIYYVYVYIDPRNNTPFYVGKGCGNRYKRHLLETSESTDNRRKYNKIRKLISLDLQPTIKFEMIDVDEETAYNEEERLIKDKEKLEEQLRKEEEQFKQQFSTEEEKVQSVDKKEFQKMFQLYIQDKLTDTEIECLQESIFYCIDELVKTNAISFSDPLFHTKLENALYDLIDSTFLTASTLAGLAMMFSIRVIFELNISLIS